MKLSSEDVSYQTPPGLKGNTQVGHSASLSPLLKEKDKGDIGLLPRKVPVDPDVTLDHFFMNIILKADLGPHRHQARWFLDLGFIVQPQEFCYINEKQTNKGKLAFLIAGKFLLHHTEPREHGHRDLLGDAP